MKIDIQKLNKLAFEKGIKLIVLFGSQAEKKSRSDSDYDVAVLTDGKKEALDFKEYSDLLVLLSQALGVPGEKIDLTQINEANPLLQKEIFFKGQLLFGEQMLFNEYQAVAFREYVDARELFETENRMIKKRLQLLNQIV